MKISKITNDSIKFNNGNFISFDHEQECCEFNYADFQYLEQYNIFPNSKENSVYELEFDEKNLNLSYDNDGFTITDTKGNKLFIPCYSEQNGYYTRDIDIYYCAKNKTVISSINGTAKWIY